MSTPKTTTENIFTRPEFVTKFDELKAMREKVETIKDLKDPAFKIDYEVLMHETLAIAESYRLEMLEKRGEVSLEHSPFENDPHLLAYKALLDELRKCGIHKRNKLRTLNRDITLNKQISREDKKKIHAENTKEIEIAKVDCAFFTPLIKKLSKDAKAYSDIVSKEYNALHAAWKKERRVAAKKAYIAEKAHHKAEHLERKEKINNRLDHKAEIELYKARLREAKNIRDEQYNNAKIQAHEAFVEAYTYNMHVMNNKKDVRDTIIFNARTYAANFVLRDYLLRNALYYIVLFYFIVTIILSMRAGSSLLTFNNLVAIAGQTSTKLFFSLGVAGLILIGGTDLSIGRITGMAAIVASIVMSNTIFTTNQGFVLDFVALPTFLKVVVALLLAILFSVIFSMLAGFFTAKFKMHPFITTLSTQLLIFGLMMILFSKVPSFRIDGDIKRMLAGKMNTNIIIASVIAVFIVWFIWNKTKFGKNMYAVGGNAEAASVSGINVFAVTMLIFVMAGVLYGIGGFFEAVRVGTAQPNTGFGTELDAIAACVVGGISFSGGIGKIRGAVIGTIIFTGITYTLTFLGYDPNIQFIFKGIIIMAAVCLDSLKYLRKK